VGPSVAPDGHSSLSFSPEEKILADEYSQLQRSPGRYDPRGRTDFDKALVTQEDVFDEGLLKLQSLIGSCGGDPPGTQAPNPARTGQPSNGRYESFKQIDNTDNLVLASWGIKNPMNRLRASLTYSSRPSQMPPAASAPTMDQDNLDLEDDNGAVSSVSESSTYSTFGDELNVYSHDGYSHLSRGNIANTGTMGTMKTDGAYIRGTRRRAQTGRDTPKSIAAYKSTSFLGSEESQNSLMEEESTTQG